MFDRVKTIDMHRGTYNAGAQTFLIKGRGIRLSKMTSTSKYYVAGSWGARGEHSVGEAMGDRAQSGWMRSTDIKTARKQFAVIVATAILDTKNG